MDNKGFVTLPHPCIAQETELSRWQVPDFFLKLTFNMNKTFKTWGKLGNTLQLPHDNGKKFWSKFS